jgi:hypothetical protein
MAATRGKCCQLGCHPLGIIDPPPRQRSLSVVRGLLLPAYRVRCAAPPGHCTLARFAVNL